MINKPMTGAEGKHAHIYAQYPGYGSYPGFHHIQDMLMSWNIRNDLVIHGPS